MGVQLPPLGLVPESGLSAAGRVPTSPMPNIATSETRDDSYYAPQANAGGFGLCAEKCSIRVTKSFEFTANVVARI